MMLLLYFIIKEMPRWIRHMLLAWSGTGMQQIMVKIYVCVSCVIWWRWSFLTTYCKRIGYGIDIHAHRAALEYTCLPFGHGLRIRSYCIRWCTAKRLSIPLLGVDCRLSLWVERLPTDIILLAATQLLQGFAMQPSWLSRLQRWIADHGRHSQLSPWSFCFSGRSEDEYSKGCNQLIRDRRLLWYLRCSARDVLGCESHSQSRKLFSVLCFPIFPLMNVLFASSLKREWANQLACCSHWYSG